MYEIGYRKSAEKDLRKLSSVARSRVIKKILSLSANPRQPGVEKIKGYELWRVRVGDYRIVYEIHDNKLIIVIVSAKHRREVYKNL